MEIKVAIFADNKMLRESLQQLVNNTEGMACTGAFPDANKLVRNMQLANPDVVMMDINMPGLSGIEAVQMIKEKFPSVQILMQTVFEENDKIFAAICAGASGYMLKKTAPQKS
jgi:DNA-binding NarL/FixJ family response regulator